MELFLPYRKRFAGRYGMRLQIVSDRETPYCFMISRT